MTAMLVLIFNENMLFRCMNKPPVAVILELCYVLIGHVAFTTQKAIKSDCLNILTTLWLREDHEAALQ